MTDTFSHVRCLRCKRVQPDRPDVVYKCDTCGHDTGELIATPTPNQKLIRDALSLSSGTVGTLVNCSRYEILDTVQREFVAFCVRHPEMQTWQQAWRGFVVCAR